MIDYRAIYNTKADLYQRLVSREDAPRNLLPALQAIRPLAGLDVVELGAGTGRLTRLVANLARRVVAVDIAPAMLAEAMVQVEGVPAHWIQADNRCLPLSGEQADLALAGWSLGHFVGWYGAAWSDEVGRAVTEMRRVLRPGGVLVILETLGTGRTRPQPPTAGLAAYYRYLEEEVGCEHTWIRTDYRFASAAEAKLLLSFFFGARLAREALSSGATTVPECTGLWWRTI
ncbi:MAG: class I SAM-dependent methyltransferase [Candidatus Promineifilaceae bacterium]|nr:class I SAM-dependent methyltransferase [Candidatus Promineifilaceae bacterium]